MATNASEAAVPYHEPGIVTILILTSFLLALNVVNSVMDRITYVGLLGQVFIGIAWGTPGAKWLGLEVETVVVNLGYLGLLLLVYEGGLTTSFQSLKANLWLSLCVATTGIVLPIGLSYVLMTLANATPLQAFAAGAALCSTSLGTTFTVMQTSGLNATRMGVVLTSAAMMDDVVGLVMVQVISNLGRGSSSFSAVTIIRPIAVSVAFGVAVPVVCRFLVLPLTTWLNMWRTRSPGSTLSKALLTKEMALTTHTTLLVGMITGATYAGTSNLFAAYLTGAAVSWWDSEVPHDIAPIQESLQSGEKEVPGATTPPLTDPAPLDSSDEQITTIAPSTDHINNRQEATCSHPQAPAEHRGDQNRDEFTGITTFEMYYHQPLQRILKPFFFASIGFSIPITRMFTGSIVWRGFIYTALMLLGKLTCGFWLMRMRMPAWLARLSPKRVRSKEATAPTQSAVKVASEPDTTQAKSHQTPQPAKPVSLYPSAILGCAMVARGEIGFLISSLAEANGIFGAEANGPLFLIVTWAIMLCTIIGPVCVGLMVKRVKRLSSGRQGEGGDRRDVLGVWGVS